MKEKPGAVYDAVKNSGTVTLDDSYRNALREAQCVAGSGMEMFQAIDSLFGRQVAAFGPVRCHVTDGP